MVGDRSWLSTLNYHACTHTHIHTRMHARTTHAHICAHICAHTHTHTHSLSSPPHALPPTATAPPRRHNHSDLQILKNIKASVDARVSVCHSATILANAYMHAGD